MRACRVSSRAPRRLFKLACPVLLLVFLAAACGSKKSAGFGPGGSGLGDDTDGSIGGGGSSGGGSSDDGGSGSFFDATKVTLPDVDLPDVPMVYQAYDGDLVNAPGGCKAGHYEGNFTGIYSSFITFIGLPIDVSGTVSLDVDESSNGEFYTISNGHVTGVATLPDGSDAASPSDGGGGGIPYWCDVVGTLNCKTKQVENAGIKNCGYCVGIADIDAETCLGLEGNFEGPVTGQYDSSIHAFVNGTWAANEVTDANLPIDEAGAIANVPDAAADGGVCQYGLLSFGGCGTWSAQYIHP